MMFFALGVKCGRKIEPVPPAGEGDPARSLSLSNDPKARAPMPVAQCCRNRRRVAPLTMEEGEGVDSARSGGLNISLHLQQRGCCCESPWRPSCRYRIAALAG